MIRFREAVECAVLSIVTSENEIAEQIVDWQPNGTIMVEIWPLSGKQIRDLAGVTEQSTHLGLTTGFVQSNTRIVSDLDIYHVGYVADWGSHREMILEKVS